MNFGHKGLVSRAAPDVPELVRYERTVADERQEHFGMVEHRYGEYVLHSQAAKIIAELDNRACIAEYRFENAINFVQPLLMRRAEDAEAKLSQYEAQEPVMWVDDTGLAAFGINGVSTVHTQFESHRSDRFKHPLYAAPISDSLKAENEKLREALKPFAEYMRDYGDKDNHGAPAPDAQGVGWIYLNHGHFRAARAALNVEASHDKA